MIGETISHYKITAKLGAGGMGEVYLATDTKLDRQVALKFLPPHFTKDPEFKGRFEHEAKAAAALNHPNIVTVHELNEYEGRLFIVMEYVEGKSLEALIGEGDLPVNRILDIIGQVCAGLGEAHQAGIIHRDIKPSNILIDRKGRAKILDFGLAKSHRATTETKTGTTLGTLQYESPEQCVGSLVDARSDLFSLGSVLYEIITGRPPFTGEVEEAIRYSILNEEPEPLARYKSGASQDLQRIVSKLLEKDPKLRYQTAGDLFADLSRLGTRPVGVRRSRTPLLLVAVALIAIIGGGLWLSRDRPASAPDEIKLAVLPFHNLGDTEDEYFADGITDEITSRLWSVPGLGVISRSSAYAFKDSDKPLPDIARQLGVRYVLDGTLRWDRNSETSRVLITPQLIDVTTDSYLWSDRYLRDMTDVFAIQAEVAARVVEALNIALGPSSELDVPQVTTSNLAAYDCFLRGRQLWAERKWEESQRLLEEAVTLDSTFAAAYALLSQVCTWQSRWNASLAKQAREAAETSLRLAPGSGAGHRALGMFHYVVRNDYDSAGMEFTRALETLPQDGELHTWLGLTRRRKGQWNEAKHHLKLAVVYDPFDYIALANFVETCAWMKRFAEALEQVDSLIARSPQSFELYVEKIDLVHSLGGAVDDLRSLLDVALGQIDTTKYDIVLAESVERFAYVEYMLSGNLERAKWYADLWRRHLANGEFAELGSIEYHVCIGDLYRYASDLKSSRIHFDSALTLFEKQYGGVQVAQSQIYNDRLRAQIYASLGMNQQALSLLDSLLAQADLTQNLFFETQMEWAAVTICLRVGEVETAIDYLERLAKKPSPVCQANLRDDPEYIEIRNHPRFQALLAQGDKVF